MEGYKHSSKLPIKVNNSNSLFLNSNRYYISRCNIYLSFHLTPYIVLQSYLRNWRLDQWNFQWNLSNWEWSLQKIWNGVVGHFLKNISSFKYILNLSLPVWFYQNSQAALAIDKLVLEPGHDWLINFVSVSSRPRALVARVSCNWYTDLK